MFRNLRWKLTALFVISSTGLFLAAGLIGHYLAFVVLTNSLDQQLKQIAAGLYPFINSDGQEPDLSLWKHKVRPASLKLFVDIEVFDAGGKLVEEHGSRLAVPLLPAEHSNCRDEVVAGTPIRVFCQPLLRQTKIFGWLQIAQNTSFRDAFLRQYHVILVVLTAVLIPSLTAAGYLVAGIAINPIRQSFDVLRRFVADAGHELKTPLTLLQANAEVLELTLSDCAAALKPLAGITQTCQKMNKIVSDLILLAKLESPEPAFPRQNMNLAMLIQETVDELAPLYAAKGISLINRVSPHQMWCHPDSLRIAISNLLGNALAYTQNGGTVTITLKVGPGSTTIEVSDTGIGIPDDQTAKIFDRFYRGAQVKDGDPSGSGLGLAIAKAVVAAHGGTLHVKSVVGEGSTFTIALPSNLHVDSTSNK